MIVGQSQKDLSVCYEVISKLSEQLAVVERSQIMYKRMLKYAGKYDISIQFWGESNTNVFIEKDGIHLTDFGGLDPDEAIKKCVEYLDIINTSKTIPPLTTGKP